jgi:hypothetical protein
MSLCSLFCSSLINRVNSLETQIAQLQNQLAAIRSSNVMALDPYVTVQTTGMPKVVFSGINVQIVNGLGQTDSINGLGNLIIGYDKQRGGCVTNDMVCSIGGTAAWGNGDINYPQQMCSAAGGVLACDHKGGSHYLIVGDLHNYSQYGGVVFGYKNTSNRAWATVTGGSSNHAGGEAASVSGGVGSLAQGKNSSVCGGHSNYADGPWTSVSGGNRNAAFDNFSTVCGGVTNVARGEGAHVSGGEHNMASSSRSSILGGFTQVIAPGGSHQTIPSLP